MPPPTYANIRSVGQFLPSSTASHQLHRRKAEEQNTHRKEQNTLHRTFEHLVILKIPTET